jgi:hypothetical protein
VADEDSWFLFARHLLSPGRSPDTCAGSSQPRPAHSVPCG